MQKNAKQRNVVGALLRWYKRQGRTLPWRQPVQQAGDISNPYRILVSEVMLQQTQVSRVLMKYPEFLRRFPSLRSLAQARQRDVVFAWQGMGYNNRAVRLHRFAQTVIRHHGGRIPSTFEALIALPGIGRYTANALLSSAFGKPVAIVDVNVQRVLSRLFRRMTSFNALLPANEVWKLAEKILPRRKAYDWNQALMDLGASVCTARGPKCIECPVARYCSSRSSMATEPASRKKREAGLDGIPNRMYRGRIIEQLRNAGNRHSLPFEALGRAIHQKFSKANHAWLESVLSGLAKDGLVRVSGNGVAKTRRVTLV